MRALLGTSVLIGSAPPPAGIDAAMTAQVHDAVLMTHDVADFRHVQDVVTIASPAEHRE